MSHPLHLTGAAVLVFRDTKVLQAAPAGELGCSAKNQQNMGVSWEPGMEKKLRAAVHDELASALKSTWPQFEHIAGAIKGEARSGGCQVFRWHADDGVWFFLTLVIGSDNTFGFRFMWSDKSAYPADDVAYPWFQNDPARMPGSCSFRTKTRGGALQHKEWQVGVNTAFVPVVVVPAAIAELKKALGPVTQEVLMHHGKNAEPPGAEAPQEE